MDDINAVSKLLALQERMQVVQQQAQVVLPGTVGHNDGCPGPGLTPCRAVSAPRFYPGLHSQRAWTPDDTVPGK